MAELCTDPNVLKAIMVIKMVVNILKILVPIVLIVVGMKDFFKATLDSDDRAIKDATTLFIRKSFIAAAIFMVPTIVGAVFNVATSNVDNQNATFVSCFKNSNSDYIKNLESSSSCFVCAKQNRYVWSKNAPSDKCDGGWKKDNSKNTKYTCTYTPDYKEKPTVDGAANLPVDNTPSSGGNNSGGQNNPSSGGSSSSNVQFGYNYPSDVVENMAAFIAMEAGGRPEGLTAQFITGAVYINNYYQHVNKPFTTASMCEMFSYASAYTKTYCYLTFDKVTKLRGGIPDSQKQQLYTVAKIILNREFTIPKAIIVQASESIIKRYGYVWGKSYAGYNRYVYFGYSKYSRLEGVDVYGNHVSTNFADYDSIARNVYNKYK